MLVIADIMATLIEGEGILYLFKSKKCPYKKKYYF